MEANEQQTKFIQERINVTEKNFATLQIGSLGVIREDARLRDKLDSFAKVLADYGQMEAFNLTLAHGLNSLANAVTFIADIRDLEVERMTAKVSQELAQFEGICKKVKEKMKESISMRDKEVSKTRKGSNKSEAELIKAHLDATRILHDIEKQMLSMEQQKLNKLKEILIDFVLIQLKMHSGAVEILSSVYQDVSDIDEKADLQQIKKHLRRKDFTRYNKMQRNRSQSFETLLSMFSSAGNKLNEKSKGKSPDTMKTLNEESRDSSESDEDSESETEPEPPKPKEPTNSEKKLTKLEMLQSWGTLAAISPVLARAVPGKETPKTTSTKNTSQKPLEAKKKEVEKHLPKILKDTKNVQQKKKSGVMAEKKQIQQDSSSDEEALSKVKPLLKLGNMIESVQKEQKSQEQQKNIMYNETSESETTDTQYEKSKSQNILKVRPLMKSEENLTKSPRKTQQKEQKVSKMQRLRSQSIDALSSMFTKKENNEKSNDTKNKKTEKEKQKQSSPAEKPKQKGKETPKLDQTKKMIEVKPISVLKDDIGKTYSSPKGKMKDLNTKPQIKITKSPVRFKDTPTKSTKSNVLNDSDSDDTDYNKKPPNIKLEPPKTSTTSNKSFVTSPKTQKVEIITNKKVEQTKSPKRNKKVESTSESESSDEMDKRQVLPGKSNTKVSKIENVHSSKIDEKKKVTNKYPKNYGYESSEDDQYCEDEYEEEHVQEERKPVKSAFTVQQSPSPGLSKIQRLRSQSIEKLSVMFSGTKEKEGKTTPVLSMKKQETTANKKKVNDWSSDDSEEDTNVKKTPSKPIIMETDKNKGDNKLKQKALPNFCKVHKPQSFGVEMLKFLSGNTTGSTNEYSNKKIVKPSTPKQKEVLDDSSDESDNNQKRNEQERKVVIVEPVAKPRGKNEKSTTQKPVPMPRDKMKSKDQVVVVKPYPEPLLAKPKSSGNDKNPSPKKVEKPNNESAVQQVNNFYSNIKIRRFSSNV